MVKICAHIYIKYVFKTSEKVVQFMDETKNAVLTLEWEEAEKKKNKLLNFASGCVQPYSGLSLSIPAIYILLMILLHLLELSVFSSSKTVLRINKIN